MARKSKVAITDEILAQFKAEIKRTGTGAIALLKNAQKDIPSGLTASLIESWLGERTRLARKDYLDYVLGKWKAISEDDCLLDISPETLQELNQLREKTGISPFRLFKCFPPPDGLKSQIVDNWFSGAVSNARRGHLDFTLKAWRKIHEAQQSSPRKSK